MTDTPEPRHGGRRLPLQGLMNTRDLGGIRTADGRQIRHRRLLRSGTLALGTASDLATLFDTYALKTIVDFRDTQEKLKHPDPVPPGVTHLACPVFTEEHKGITREGLDLDGTTVILDEHAVTRDAEAVEALERHIVSELVNYLAAMGNAPGENLRQGYALMVSQPHSLRAYRRFFDAVLAQTEGSLLFHCSAGKDRVGVGALLLLTALGVPLDRALEDYLFSNVCYASRLRRIREAARERGLGPEIEAGIQALVGVDRSLIDTALATIRETHGDIDTFLRDALKLTDSERTQLQAMYLEDL